MSEGVSTESEEKKVEMAGVCSGYPDNTAMHVTALSGKPQERGKSASPSERTVGNEMARVRARDTQRTPPCHCSLREAPGERKVGKPKCTDSGE